MTSDNSGIRMSGGSITAQALAVGKNARATVNNAAAALAAAGRDEISDKLQKVLDLLDDHGADLPKRDDAYQLVERIASEAARDKPDRFNLKGFLAALADEVKSVATLVPAVASLATVVAALFA